MQDAEPQPVSVMARLGAGLMMFAVALGSLLLLIYVGYGEVSRTYPRFVIEKMAAQAELVKAPLETHLRAGLPFAQFPGFRQIAERLRESDPAVAAVTATGRGGAVVFASGEANVPLPGAGAPETQRVVREDGEWLQVRLPLQDRFGPVGAVSVTTPRAELHNAVWPSFPPLIASAFALSVLFGLLAALGEGRLSRSRWPWLEIAYAAMFAALAGMVLASLVSIYAVGAQAKARALADSLTQRLEPVMQYGLRIDDFEGLGRISDEYRALDPDIRSIAIMVGGRVRLHTESGRVGDVYWPDPGSYVFTNRVGGNGEAEVSVSVTLPTEIVWSAVARSAKNFAALFVAVALLSALFLRLARSFGARKATGAEPASSKLLDALTPIFFLSVFVESLPTGFLPQLLRGAAEASGRGTAAASLAFTAYFVCFLVVLVPGAQMALRFGERALVAAGAAMAGAAALMMAHDPSFESLMAARALAGFGQGLMLVGAQNFVLLRAPAARRTQAAAVIVFGFNGGMIAGAAIGSLLVNYVNARGVFLVGAATSAAVLLFALALLPATPGRDTPRGGILATLRELARNTGKAMHNAQFLRTMICVGIPSKAVLTGIVAFGLPLTLAGLGFAPEDIGQLVMLYPGGVLLASGWVSRRVDAAGGAGRTLTAGMLLSGLGMLMVGSLGWTLWPGLAAGGREATLLIGAGVLLLGLSHGFINAPVITHVAQGDLADEIGAAQAAGLYRVLERVGHVAGPAAAGQLIVVAGGGPAAIGVAGAITLALGLLFWLPLGPGRRKGMEAA